MFQTQEWQQHQEVMLDIVKNQNTILKSLSKILDDMQKHADNQMKILQEIVNKDELENIQRDKDLEESKNDVLDIPF